MIGRITLAIVLAVLPALACAELVGVDCGPEGKSPQNWNSISSNGNYLKLINDEGQPTVVGLYVRNAGTPYAVTPNPASLPEYKSSLSALDGNLYQFGGTFEAQINGLVPLQPYKVYVFGLRGGAGTRQSISMAGGKGVVVSQSAPDGVLTVNDQPGDSRRPLASYAKSVVASRDGTIDLAITGGPRANQTFVVAGLAIEGDFPGSATTMAGQSGPPAQQTMAAQGSEQVTKRARMAEPVTSTPTGPDVIGVYLDMPMDEALAVIAAEYPEIPMKPFQWSIGQVQNSRILGGEKYVAGYQGTYNASGRTEAITLMSYMPPNDGRVAGITRYTFVGEMLLSDFLASIEEKYGKPLADVPADTILRKPYQVLSWSLTRDGKPQQDPLTIVSCVYQATSGNPWEHAAQVNLWDTKVAMNGQFDKCGFTFAILPTNLSNNMPPTIRGFGVTMYDFNKIRKAARETWEETDRIATQLEQEKAEKLAGKKPRL